MYFFTKKYVKKVADLFGHFLQKSGLVNKY
jgi:hypothetical protein